MRSSVRWTGVKSLWRLLMSKTAAKPFDRLSWQRDYRKSNGNARTKKYEKTKKGKLMRTYRNMESRAKGIVKGKSHLYQGLEVLPRETFYDWAMSCADFNNIYDDWVRSGFDRKLSPSVDRVDPSKGYTLDNMRWLTHSENSSIGAKNRVRSG